MVIDLAMQIKDEIKHLITKNDELQAQVDSLTAELEAQRKRANDAERGVLSEEWYVSRDRYEDEIAELTAERDELNMRINGLVGELGDTEGTALSLQAKCDDLRSRLKTQANSFQKLERDNAKLRDTLARVRELVGDAE